MITRTSSPFNLPPLIILRQAQPVSRINSPGLAKRRPVHYVFLQTCIIPSNILSQCTLQIFATFLISFALSSHQSPKCTAKLKTDKLAQVRRNKDWTSVNANATEFLWQKYYWRLLSTGYNYSWYTKNVLCYVCGLAVCAITMWWPYKYSQSFSEESLLTWRFLLGT